MPRKKQGEAGGPAGVGVGHSSVGRAQGIRHTGVGRA